MDLESREVTYIDSIASRYIKEKAKKQIHLFLAAMPRNTGNNNFEHVMDFQCQQQNDSMNGGIFALNHIECMLLGEDSGKSVIEPDTLGARYASSLLAVGGYTDQILFDELYAFEDNHKPPGDNSKPTVTASASEEVVIDLVSEDDSTSPAHSQVSQQGVMSDYLA